MQIYNSFNELASANMTPVVSNMSVFNAASSTKNKEDADTDDIVMDVDVVIKIEKETGKPVLFYQNSNDYTTWIEGVTPLEGHFEVQDTYLSSAKVRDPKTPEEKQEADKLFKWYQNFCDSTPGEKQVLHRVNSFQS